jgi:hypothetical protein
VALAFHDLGIWTDGTFDYLPPSVRRMQRSVAAQAPELDADVIEAMIQQHHKITLCAARSRKRWKFCAAPTGSTCRWARPATACRANSAAR